MSDVRLCPFCSKQMEHDSLTGRFVCPECGRSESAQGGVDLRISVPQSSTIQTGSIQTSTSQKDTPQSSATQKGTARARTFKTKTYYTDALIMPPDEKDAPLVKEKSQANGKDADEKRHRETSKELERHAVPSTSVTKDDAYSILRSYSRDLGCDSLEEVLRQSDQTGSEEYINRISNHPALQTLQEVLPKCRIPGNITEFCTKVQQSSRLEKELRKSQDDLKKTEDYVKRLEEKRKRFPFSRNKRDNSIIIALLIIPLCILFPVLFGYDDDEPGFIQSKADVKTLFFVIMGMYAIVFGILAITGIYSAIRNRPRKEGAKLIEIKKKQVDVLFSRIMQLHEEKEAILKDILIEEQSVREKSSKKRERY